MLAASMLPGVFVAIALQPDAALLRPLYEQALARRQQESGMADAGTAQAARDLGLFLARQGDMTAAQGALAQAVTIDTAAFGDSAPRTLAAIADLAAVTPPRDSIPLWMRASDSPDPATSARALGALGDLHAQAGDRAGAAGFYRRALAREESATGRNSQAAAMRLNALAQTVEPKEAILLLARALAIDRKALGPRHPQTATTEANLAGQLVNVRRHEDAIRAATDALSVFQETLGPDHPRCAVTASILAFALEATGRRTQAEKMYRLAVSIDEQAYGPAHPQTLNDVKALAEFLRISGRVREAAELAKRADAGR